MINRDYAVYYNGQSSLDLGLVVEHRPTFPSAEPNVTEFEIPARDGILHRSEGTVQDVEIQIPFAFVVEDDDDWLPQFRRATAWLYDTSDNKLILSEDPEWYYEVISVLISDDPVRVNWHGGQFTATFKIRGYAYALSGIKPQTNYYNKFDISHPIYRLTGNVNATLTVNGKTMTANIGQDLTIDTDLMIAYRTNSGALQNTSVTGDYTDLWLNPGHNTISVSNGATLAVYPRWRKRL